MKKHLPAEPKPGKAGGRPRIGNRAVLNGIWYVLWTGCQWKAVHRDWFGVSSSVLHERFQTWQAAGRLGPRSSRRWSSSTGVSATSSGSGKRSTAARAPPRWAASLRAKTRPIGPSWARRSTSWSISGVRRWPSRSVAPTSTTSGRSPPGVPYRRAPSRFEQHFLADKGYDYDDVYETSSGQAIVPHIKHRRRRGEPRPIPVRCRVRRSIRPDAGSSSAPSAGWSSAAACAPVGARSPATGWPSFSSLAPASCAT